MADISIRDMLAEVIPRDLSGPRVKLVRCKSALTAPPPSQPRWFILLTRSKEVVPVLVLLFVALWFILRGDLF